MMNNLMSTEEKDAQIGRLFRERKEAKEALVHLTAAARSLCKTLVELETALRDNPVQTTLGCS
jgi:hypothetical protein